MLKSRLIIIWLHAMSWLPLSVARGIGSLLGRLLWWCQGTLVKTTRTNLALCLPEMDEQSREALARESLRQTGMLIAEAGAIWLWPAERIQSRLQIRGYDILQEAHASGRGVIVIGPHLGNWELLGLYLSIGGLGQTLQMYQAPRDPALGRFIYNARSRAGATMVATDTRGVSRLLAGLRQGLITGILPDQVPPDSGGKFAPFFGHPALTMTLLTRLLRKTGSRAVVAYTRRVIPEQQGTGAQGEAGTKSHGFEIVFMTPDPRIYAADDAESLQGLNASIEAAVRQDPAIYQWSYKRFKRQPDGSRIYD